MFLAPAIAGGQEARGQRWLVDFLFWVTLLVVAGALIGDYLGIMGVIDQNWFWFGNQGLSYIQLGRFWQIGFFVGLALWSLLVMRALWPTAVLWRKAAGQFWSGRIRFEHLIWASTINIAILYIFGMIPLTGIEKSFTLTDFWRWWVVHLWVEQSFEFFAACMTAYLLMSVGLVSRKLAERATYFEIILIFLGGVIGTGHVSRATGRVARSDTTFACVGPRHKYGLASANHRIQPGTRSMQPVATGDQSLAWNPEKVGGDNYPGTGGGNSYFIETELIWRCGRSR